MFEILRRALPFPLAVSFDMRWDLLWCCSHGDRYSWGLATNRPPTPFGVPKELHGFTKKQFVSFMMTLMPRTELTSPSQFPVLGVVNRDPGGVALVHDDRAVERGTLGPASVVGVPSVGIGDLILLMMQEEIVATEPRPRGGFLQFRRHRTCDEIEAKGETSLVPQENLPTRLCFAIC